MSGKYYLFADRQAIATNKANSNDVLPTVRVMHNGETHSAHAVIIRGDAIVRSDCSAAGLKGAGVNVFVECDEIIEMGREDVRKLQ